MTYFGGAPQKKIQHLQFFSIKNRMPYKYNNKNINILTVNNSLNKKKFIKFGRVKKKHLIYQLEI